MIEIENKFLSKMQNLLLQSEEKESFSTKPSGPRPRPPLSRMTKPSKSSPKKPVKPKSQTHSNETNAYMTRKNESNDDEILDSESNSLNNDSTNSSNSEFKIGSQINQEKRIVQQRKKQRKNGKSVESLVLHKAVSKDINHTVVSWSFIICILLSTLFFCVALSYMTNFNNSNSEKNIAQFEKDIEYVKKKFPIQMPDIWDDFCAGVKTIIEESSKRPAVFVLLANNSNTINCLSKSLGNIISQSLGGKECLILGPKNFISNPGEMLEWLRPKIEQKKVVVVNDILKINSEALGSFHWLCDDTNPVVSRAVYLITMTINKLHANHDNLIKLVEERIYNTFSNAISFDILHATVSRITSGAILPILSEPNLTEGAECP